VALLDEARTALAHGDASGALAFLGRHDREYPRGFLGSEAEVLRIQALFAQGQKEQARRRAEALLAREPNGPQAKRVRSLLDAQGIPQPR
jgi:outer membrane protein assembly factor BamD (BamD/ComL family)